MLKEKLMEELKNAMKNKDEIRKNTVQMVRAAILQIEKDKNLFIIENLIIGMCSFYLTMIFILLVSNVINKFVYSCINFEHIMSLDILNIILLFFLSLILCYVASFIPAKIASNKKIVDIFNN